MALVSNELAVIYFFLPEEGAAPSFFKEEGMAW
jgi:hypothetical protein